MKRPICFIVAKTFEKRSSRCWIKAVSRPNRFQGRSCGLTLDLLLSILSGRSSFRLWRRGAKLALGHPCQALGLALVGLQFPNRQPCRCDPSMGRGWQRPILEARENAFILLPNANGRETLPDVPHTRATLRLEPPEDMPVFRTFLRKLFIVEQCLILTFACRQRLQAAGQSSWARFDQHDACSVRYWSGMLTPQSLTWRSSFSRTGQIERLRLTL